MSEERKDVPKHKVYICRFKGDRNLLISTNFLQMIFIIYNYIDISYIFMITNDFSCLPQIFILQGSGIPLCSQIGKSMLGCPGCPGSGDRINGDGMVRSMGYPP